MPNKTYNVCYFPIAAIRSRSAPPRTTSSPASIRKESSSPAASPLHRGAIPKAWVDTRHALLETADEDQLEIKTYDMDDVERMQRRRKEEIEVILIHSPRNAISLRLALGTISGFWDD